MSNKVEAKTAKGGDTRRSNGPETAAADGRTDDTTRPSRPRGSLVRGVVFKMSMTAALLAGLTLLHFISYLQVGKTTRLTSDFYFPAERLTEAILHNLREAQASSNNYLLGDERSRLKFENQLDGMLADYQHLEQTAATHRMELGIGRIGSRIERIADSVRQRIFNSYSPSNERLANKSASQTLTEIAGPLELSLTTLAAKELADTRESDYQQLIEDDLPGLSYYLKLADAASDMHAAISRYLLQDPSSREHFYASALDFERQMVLLKPLEQDLDDVVEIREVERLFENLRHRGEEIFQLFVPQERNDALHSLGEIHSLQFAVLERELEALSENLSSSMGSSLADVHQHTRAYTIISLSLATIGMVLCIATALWAKSKIARPIAYLASDVNRLRSGERNVVFPGGINEFEHLYYSLDQLQGQLREQDETERSRAQQLSELESSLAESQERLKVATEQLQNSDKLISLGSLVAGVTHEVNTPIGVAVSMASTCSELVQSFTSKLNSGQISQSDARDFDSSSRENLELLLTSLEQASTLLQSFKRVASDQASESRREFLLHELLNEVMMTLHHRIKRTRVECNIECPPDISLDSYPGPLGQVVQNMINNTLLHAFDENQAGELAIEAYCEGNKEVVIIFRDNGKGILARNIDRIFDPFFSTKIGKGGSGLGLNIVHKIVTQVLGGDIRVDSRFGSGTRFTVIIPFTAPQLETHDGK